MQHCTKALQRLAYQSTAKTMAKAKTWTARYRTQSICPTW